MKRIAIIDDERDVLNVLEKFLHRNDQLSIEIFDSPVGAFETIKSQNFDLILLDIMMPLMDGITFLKKIKEVKPNIKVIMMTAASTQDRVIECKKTGAEDYLTKPFISLRDVENKVLDHLGL